MSSVSSSGPNPLCEVGMRHPRDRHRMRPVEGSDHVWFCSKHGIYAQLADVEVAESVSRGDDWTGFEGVDGLVVRHGDERLGGQIVYFRAK
jgi:hypothetical protein